MSARSPEETYALLEVVEKLQADGLALSHARWSIVGIRKAT